MVQILHGKSELLFPEVILGKEEGPGFVGEGLGVASCDPEFIHEHKGGMLVPFLPASFGLELFPVFAILGMPDVAPIFGRVVGPAPHHPDAVPVHSR